MSRPLLITDCDEVLLHMVRHFRDWVSEAHDMDFALEHGDFERRIIRRRDRSAVTQDEMWDLLGGFFPAEMGRQTLVPGAAEALARLHGMADIVVLTNLSDACRQPRADQLADHGMTLRVECNHGGKGPAVVRLVDEFAPSVTVFVDDLAGNHASVAKHAPHVHRLHLVAEPVLAATMPTAEHAHARIDDWARAEGWITDRFAAGTPAPAPQEIAA